MDGHSPEVSLPRSAQAILILHLLLRLQFCWLMCLMPCDLTSDFSSCLGSALIKVCA